MPTPTFPFFISHEKWVLLWTQDSKMFEVLKHILNQGSQTRGPRERQEKLKISLKIKTFYLFVQYYFEIQSYFFSLFYQCGLQDLF